jgi:hypothetical protein
MGPQEQAKSMVKYTICSQNSSPQIEAPRLARCGILHLADLGCTSARQAVARGPLASRASSLIGVQHRQGRTIVTCVFRL